MLGKKNVTHNYIISAITHVLVVSYVSKLCNNGLPELNFLWSKNSKKVCKRILLPGLLAAPLTSADNVSWNWKSANPCKLGSSSHASASNSNWRMNTVEWCEGRGILLEKHTFTIQKCFHSFHERDDFLLKKVRYAFQRNRCNRPV